MQPRTPASAASRGQMIVLFTMALTGIVLVVGVVLDGGYALVQRRSSQNTADFAALAGARVVAEWIAGNAADGTDANVQAAIANSIAVNGGTPLTFGVAGGPTYVATDATPLGNVGAGTIPIGTVGVRLSASRSWAPYFLRLVGINTWTASAVATARGGYSASAPPQEGVFPMGIAEAFFDGRQPCSGPLSDEADDPCHPAQMTAGNLNVPGGFGWLKFGCSGYGLGQEAPANAGGCASSKPFLQTEIGPPGNSYGCCTAVGQPGSADLVGSLPGNKASADCDYYVANHLMIMAAVWDIAGGSGSNAWYHIVGFTGFQITDCNGGKDIRGVWRQPFYLGPTTTIPGFAGAPLAVQLIE